MGLDAASLQHSLPWAALPFNILADDINLDETLGISSCEQQPMTG